MLSVLVSFVPGLPDLASRPDVDVDRVVPPVLPAHDPHLHRRVLHPGGDGRTSKPGRPKLQHLHRQEPGARLPSSPDSPGSDFGRQHFVEGEIIVA